MEGHINEIETECLDCRENAKDAVHEIFITMEHIIEEFSNMNPMYYMIWRNFISGLPAV